MGPLSINTIRKFSGLTTFFIGLTAVALLLYAGIYHDPVLMLKEFLEDEVPPMLFLVLMFILPLVAAPNSVFLLLVGMKFGMIPGILISGGTMLFHISMSYWLSRNLLYLYIDHLPGPLRRSVDKLSQLQSRWSALFFMLVPGLPYMIKNVLLAQTRIGFFPYMAINWGTQFALGIPLIVLGRAVIDMNVTILGAAIILLLAVFLIQLILKKRENDQNGVKDGK